MNLPVATCFYRLKSAIYRLSRHGVNNERDESNQKYIILMNLISMVSCYGLCSTGFILLFMGEFFQCFLHFIGGLVWLSPIYINRNGLKVASRLVVIIYSAVVLLLCSIWFTHDSTLDNYFLIVAITCLFLFSPRERKWLMFCVTLCLSLFVVESTPLQHYLPSYDMLNGERLKFTNLVLLAGQIILVLMDVICFTYVSRIRENNLLTKQKQLEEAQYKVQLQNDDLKTFSIAASHSMQMPLYVAGFFVQKLQLNHELKEDVGIQEDIGMIRSGIDQIEQLVSGLFSYNRIINIENELTEFNVKDEVNKIKVNILESYKNGSIHIEGDDAHVKTNQLLFSIIVHNLFDNALKYNVSAFPAVTVKVRAYGIRVLLYIQDNGIGIPSQYLPVIFEPFKKIMMSNGLKSGNRLGLAGSKRAAERIGGILTCVRSNEQGTLFSLDIPHRS